LAERNEEVEAFVYIVSHDLRAPLVNLQGFAKELDASCRELEGVLENVPLATGVRDRLRPILDDGIRGALRYISASTTKFQRLIDALLVLSRSGRQEYRSEEVDVEWLVKSTLDSLRQSIDECHAGVAVGTLPRASGDVTAIGQVFSNLVGNALKYHAPERAPVIEIGGQREQTMAHYWIRDNGAGIPAPVQRRLFQVFQRFHPDLAPGEGMGLAIVKRVVEKHGGKVWADSQEGIGTTFHLTLPAAKAEATP
jgi:signal transduction histidine kinase